MENLVEVKNLAVSYFTYAGEVQSVRGVTFDIKSGKTTAIVGESGCGKTVTAKALMGLIHRPGKVLEESQILFKGKDIINLSKKEKNEFCGKECSMIFQDALVSLNPTMKIGKQITENLTNHNKSIPKKELKRKATEMLQLVEIPDAEKCLEKYPHELSGGMRQRIMIAMALVTHPNLLIADEPTTALDVTIQAQIISLMKELQKKMGMSIVLITHDLGVVADIADEIVVMYAGKIVEKGKCRESVVSLKAEYEHSLDYEKKQPLVTIEGGIPDMTNPPKGCAFCQRCPYAMNICSEYEPTKTTLADGHEVWCWLLDKRADLSKVPEEIRRRKDE